MADAGLVVPRVVQARERGHGQAAHLRLRPLPLQSRGHAEERDGACALRAKQDELSPHHQSGADLRVKVQHGEKVEVGSPQGIAHACHPQTLHQLLWVQNEPDGC